MISMAINDLTLLAYNIIFTFLLLLILAVVVFAFISIKNPDENKRRKIRKDLETKAKTDPYAKKKLDKMKRKGMKSSGQERLQKIFAFVVLTVLFGVMLEFFFIPGWTDYIKKDYVVYEGKIRVEHYRRHWYTFLDDDTYLRGGLGLSEGEHNKTIVYSRRTEIALDIID